MFKEFDKVFVINLKKDTKRKDTTISRMNKLGLKEGLDYEFFQATPGRSKFVKMGSSSTFDTEGWNRNAAALSYTTKKIIKLAKENKWNSVLIFEDDTVFVNNFKYLYNNSIKHLPKEYDFFHLNATHKKAPIWSKGMMHRIKAALCCQAYAVHHSVYDTYLRELEKCNAPIDEITMSLHRSRGRSYCVVPNIVKHNKNEFSTLRERIVEY